MNRPSPPTVRRLIGLLLLVAWEAVPRLGLLPELFVPPLSKTLAVLWLDRAIYGSALLVTLYEVAIAMLIACGIGILVGAVVGGVATLRNLMLPVFSSLYAVPIVILYPIFTAWFGIGSESKIAFAGVYGFFPVMLSTAAGIRTIDEQYLLAARSMGATLPQLIARVIIPASIPTVLASASKRVRSDSNNSTPPAPPPTATMRRGPSARLQAGIRASIFSRNAPIGLTAMACSSAPLIGDNDGAMPTSSDTRS